MKKINLKVAAVLMLGSLLYSSCIGTYSLFNSYAKWQRTMTSNKFINAIVGFILTPVVGSVCMLADSLVLNSIEFWTGENPVADNIGTTRDVMGSDGKLYAVTTLQNGYEIKTPSGELCHFYYHADSNSWYYEQDGVETEVFRFNADGTLSTQLADGQQLTLTTDEAGAYEARMAANEGTFFAMR